MIRMKVGINNPHLEELQYLLAKMGTRARALSRTAGALEAGAKLIQVRWIDFAKGGHLEGVTEPLKRPSGGYARSIKTNKIGPFEHEIYSDAEIADWIENGTEDLDMKKKHPYGPRSRVSERRIIKRGKNKGKVKGGVPYLIVPFQWGTKEGTKRVGPRNIVPKNLLSIMRNKKLFDQSKVENKTIMSPNAKGQMVERHTYTWGSRAKGSDFAGTVEQKSFADGMMRFEQGSAADGKKGKRHGGYFTFRIISANSPADSWKRKGMPARHVTRALVRETEKPINEMVESAIMEDLGI